MPSARYRVTEIRFDDRGAIRTRVVDYCSTVRQALAAARRHAGAGAHYYTRGEGDYLDRGYVGAACRVAVS